MREQRARRITGLSVGVAGFSFGVNWETLIPTGGARLRPRESEILNSLLASYYPFLQESNPAIRKQAIQQSVPPEENQFFLSALFCDEYAWLFPYRFFAGPVEKKNSLGSAAVRRFLKKLETAGLIELVETVGKHLEVYVFTDDLVERLQQWWDKQIPQ